MTSAGIGIRCVVMELVETGTRVCVTYEDQQESVYIQLRAVFQAYRSLVPISLGRSSFVRSSVRPSFYSTSVVVGGSRSERLFVSIYLYGTETPPKLATVHVMQLVFPASLLVS